MKKIKKSAFYSALLFFGCASALVINACEDCKFSGYCSEQIPAITPVTRSSIEFSTPSASDTTRQIEFRKKFHRKHSKHLSIEVPILEDILRVEWDEPLAPRFSGNKEKKFIF